MFTIALRMAGWMDWHEVDAFYCAFWANLIVFMFLGILSDWETAPTFGILFLILNEYRKDYRCRVIERALSKIKVLE